MWKWYRSGEVEVQREGEVKVEEWRGVLKNRWRTVGVDIEVWWLRCR